MSRTSKTSRPPFLPHPVGISSGFAGAPPEVAQERWAEESRHRLTSPGAYEWWYFHAMSPSGDGVLITLFEGLPFHPRYLTQINRFSERLGGNVFQKKPWPSLDPARYPAAYAAVYRSGKRVCQFLNLYPPNSSAGEGGEVQIGPNRVTLRQDGSFGIAVKGYPFESLRAGPRKRSDRILAMNLSLAPTFPGVQHTSLFRAPDHTGASHHWILAAPHGRMSGEIQVLPAADLGEPAILEMELDALAYHDHVYGGGGLSTGVSTLLWGFIQGEDWTAAWHHSLGAPATRNHADGLFFFQKNHEPLIIDAPESRLAKHNFSNWLLKHPGSISMHGSDAKGHPLELLLSHPSVLETAPFHTRLSARGTLTLPGRGPALTGTGATHVLKLRRLRWPVLSDLTLLAITSIARDDPIWSQ